MKTFLLAGACMIGCQGLLAQQFDKKISVKLDEILTQIQTEWIAVDRDTLLDIVISGIDESGNLKICSYKNEGANTFSKRGCQLTGFKSGYLQVEDWDNDNDMDVIISGKTLVNTDAVFVFENKNDFTWVKNNSKLIAHSSHFRIADLNNDGRKDIILAGKEESGHFIRIYEMTEEGFVLRFDFGGFAVTDIKIFDLSNSGTNDLVFSGLDQSETASTLVFRNSGNFSFVKEQLNGAVTGQLAVIDLNEDGYFDLAISGGKENGFYIQKWINQKSKFALGDSFVGIDSHYLFSGDLNSDGVPELATNGIDESLKKSNVIIDANGQLSKLDTAGLISQRFGDFDHDGDLDLFQVADSAGVQVLRIFENKAPGINKGPDAPTNAFAFSSFNKTFIYWKRPDDDHTATPSLTYDLWLGTNSSTLITSSFDLNSGRRLKVSHGNAGSNSSYTVNQLTDDRYYFMIQSVDNAYNANNGKICTGGVLPCFDLQNKKIQVCKNEEVKLSASGSAYWFSATRGFLGVLTTLSFTASENDTIYSVVPQAQDCSKNNVWLVQVKDVFKSDSEIRYACKDQKIKLSIEPGWVSVEWMTTPPIINTNSIDFLAFRPESVLVVAKGAGECSYQKIFHIRISQPTLQLAGENFQISKGSSVQLNAISNASTYNWTPSTGLSNPSSSNPVASPLQNIEYTVEVTDSIGCKASAKVLIEVKETPFVPNLFTPNGDGKNDVLKVYGLSQANGFKFQIFNREGSIVFESSDVFHVSQSGWNGTSNGSPQPSGLYYWKIEGIAPTGERLLLNGKKTGSILLIR